MSLLTSSPTIPTLGDLLDRLGGVSPDRVRFYPLPGTATEQDVVEIEAHEDRLCELVEGVLVEKPMGFQESLLAGIILTLLNNFVMPRKLGLVTGEAGMMRLFPNLVRIPDVAFISYQRLPGGRVPREPIPAVVPDLVVEVLSKSNTVREMQRKRQEYFQAGVRLLWEVNPADRSVSVYSGAEQVDVLKEGEVLDGADVLPGFTLPLEALFAEL
jgi:Uma2 family endonuclease